MISVPPKSAALAVLLFLPMAAVTAAGAQQPPASPPSFSESLEVREAQVEVLVTDRGGQPVPGLTKEDFQVFEDGQAAEVTGASSTADQPIVLAVFLDETSLRGSARSTALAGLRRFVTTSLRPGDRVLILRWDGSLEIHGDPTGDAAALGATLDRLAAGVAGLSAAQERAAIRRDIEQANPPDDEQFRALAIAQARAIHGTLRLYADTRDRDSRAELAAVQQTLALLSTLPERKALLYVGGGIPLRPGVDLYEAWQKKFGEIALQISSSPLEFNRGNNTGRLVQETVDRANASGVALHALSLSETGAVSADTQSGASGWDPEDAARALRNLAAGTGGRVVTDVQNPAGFLERTGRDVTGSYVVGYTPPPSNKKKGRHRIEVKVRGGALAARHREERLDGGVVDPLLRRALSALWTGTETERNPLKAEVAIEEEAQEEDGRFRVTAIVALPLSAVYVQPQENFHAAHLTVAVAARDGKGRISGLPRAEFPVEIPNERLLSAPGQTAGYRFTLYLAPGESVLAVALRDDLSGAQSVVRTALTPGKTPEEKP
jgi:VWFA-related protein